MPEALAELVLATEALETAVAADDLDGIEQALATRAEWIGVLEAQLAGRPPGPAVESTVRAVIEADQRIDAALQEWEAESRVELDKTRQARRVATRLSGGRVPARFYNERI